MHLSPFPTSAAPPRGDAQDVLDTRIAWLREEAEKAESAEQRAALRYEIGLLEQRAGREENAVRDYLAAANAVGAFKEPVEHLIAIVERRRSFKNLPTLLEHSCRTAESPGDAARAQLASAWMHIMHTLDPARALAAARAAAHAVPDDPGALLTLEYLARRRGDLLALRDILARQLASASPPAWAAVLGLELANLHAAVGSYQKARQTLDGVIACSRSLTLTALRHLADLGYAAQRPDWTIEALEALIARVVLSAEPAGADAHDTAALARSAPGATDLLLELAELERRSGRDALALRALESALDLDPQNPVVVRSALALALAGGRHERVETIVTEEAARERDPAEAAALWLVLAQARAARNEPTSALEALECATAVDPACWLAWARKAELMRGTRDALGQGRMLERISALLTDAGAKRRLASSAALIFARDARDAALAARALDVARNTGGAPHVGLARLARTLADAAGDSAWYAATLDDLLAAETNEGERAGLLLECWRLAELAGDRAATQRHLDALEALPHGRFCARLARAYGSESSPESELELKRLEELEGAPPRAAALAWVRALRLAVGGQREAGLDHLLDAQCRYPRSALVAGTLTAWLAQARDGDASSARVLRALAASANDEFAASLLIEAGIRSWREGRRAEAREDFAAADRRCAGSASPLHAWVVQAAAVGSAEVEVPPSQDRREKLLWLLDRTLRATSPGPSQLTQLTAALRALGDETDDDLSNAARLSCLFLARALSVRADSRVLERFASSSAGAARVAEAWRYLECLAYPDSSWRALEESARRWADGSKTPAATLEWLAAAARCGDRKRECEALRRLASQLGGSLGEQCAAGAALLAHLSHVEPAPCVQGTTAPALLTNLETSPPGCDSGRRARALDSAAELLGEEDEPIARLLAGYNMLAVGDQVGASRCFQQYADAFPDDPAGFEGLLAAARQGDDPVLIAEATASLGNTSRDPAHAARLFEEAADIFFDRVNDPAAAQAALARAVDLDVTRTSSFVRLLALYLEVGDAPRTLELIARRLPVATDGDELARLYWERARAARRLGDTELALESLDALAELQPDHLGALALYAEICINLQRYTEAAEKLARFAAREDAPREERLTSGLYAVDLFENYLGSTKRALEVLLILHRASLGTLAVRERLARSAAKAGAWDDAVTVLEQLMFERETDAERTEAARLALAIHRDQRGDARSAGRAAEALLSIDPRDPEALDLVLSGALEPVMADALLRQGQTALASHVARQLLDADAWRRLSRIAERLGDIQCRQLALGALALLGHREPPSRSELTALDQLIDTTPTMVLPESILTGLAEAEDTGPIPELLAAFQSPLIKALGPTLSAFEVRRRDRIPPSSGSPVRGEIAAWAGAFGVGEFEVYRSAMLVDRVAVLATQPVAVLIGANAEVPLAPSSRQELARSLYAVRRGLAVLVQLDASDALALVNALCTLGGSPLPGPRYARQEDFERRLARALPRKLRRELSVRAANVHAAGSDPAAWLRAAISSLDRAAALAVADVSVIVDEMPRTLSMAAAPPSERAQRLLRFVLSPAYAVMRRELGVRPR